MDAYRAAYNTWQEKTEWVRKDKRFDILLPWGKHRADVLKEYIDHLEAKCTATDALLAEVRAQGAEECVRQLVISDDDDFYDAPNICAMVAYQLRKGVQS